MSEHYDFHYQPMGSGAISGQQVLQQTEDAINELGDYVNDNVGGAMDVAQQALETAQNAEQDAQTALDTANSFSSAIQSAQQDASTALSTAQTAQTTASNANNTAIQAQQDANTAVTTANNASGQVSTLSGTVTALGQRVTTAEGNIGQNTSDITALTNRVGTAEGNITTLQNDVTIAQGNASSAMATAGTVKQQAYVFRYSSTALVASSTNSNTLLDNTDNLKVGDKVIDSSGVLFSITAIDTANSTFTIGTALIDLAQDSDVVHKSGNETVGGSKTFSNYIPIDGTYLGNESSTNERTVLCLRSNRDTANKSCAYISRFRSNKTQGELSDSDSSFITISFLENETRYTRCFDFGLTDWDANGIPQTYYLTSPTSKGALGTSSRKWQLINGIEPSSLSLPSGNTADRLDISSYITAFDGTTNSYTPLANGWLSISVDNSTEVYVFLNNLYGVNNSRPTAGSIIVTLPVLKGIPVSIRITGGTLKFARFIPCQGNV